MERLINYFEAVSKVLDSQMAASDVFPNTTDKGTSREDFFEEFLRHHAPSRCEVVKGGYIFDSDNRESKQIDLLVINDAAVRFTPSGGKSFNAVEACLGRSQSSPT